ncbi:hypothetical protein TraAM80_01451 [Trypanosoma rangeli]|uniref:Uncharacterized protein n=1 Tax=Trypanosoma rangeli TaxID=5698 RepID=A0A3R7M7U3_TRYRA|nr:uncharacterized protein TraAM80_01451 [Trypanosoma rangeli]RNF10635.1 hypothetical protein TraAM80_01451 [Trypanosoma rangeli]|eukprot:RNF10635.1 hypothetical protein TraAM80_01451 [Trypanosoma rangeli]
MSEAGEEVTLPETLRRIAVASRVDARLYPMKAEVSKAAETPQLCASTSVPQLLELVHAIRMQYMRLVVEIAEASGTTTSSVEASATAFRQIEALAHPIAELQRGIRSKNAQCVRLELRDHLANEVEARRRALSHMRAALSIAKQCV